MPDLAFSEIIGEKLAPQTTDPRFGVGHRERVAAWCSELALALQLRTNEAEALHEAALLHDLGEGEGSNSSADIESILSHFRGTETVKEPTHARAASLLTVSDRFDVWSDSALAQSAPLRELLEHSAGSLEASGRAAGFLVKRLRRTNAEELLHVFSRLPVYPAVAMRLYALLSDSRVSLVVLEQLAKSDQVLAGKLIKASNSAFYSPVVAIGSVAKAIGYVGTEDARRILLASALQPLFATEAMRRQWDHSLQSAAHAERIAELAGLDKAEAFLLGLLHDAGRLAISLLPQSAVESIDRLCGAGCPATVAESVICGVDHAEAGAEVLSFWRFPATAVDAVRHHHQPELSTSPMASVLYLAEVWSNGDGEPPSDVRYRSALDVLAVNEQDLETARSQPVGALSGL